MVGCPVYLLQVYVLILMMEAKVAAAVAAVAADSLHLGLDGPVCRLDLTGSRLAV